MKISSGRGDPLRDPYRKPLRFASGEVRAAEHVLVRVHTDDGVVGTADAPPRPFTYGETQTSVRSIIADHFAPAIVGVGILEREVVHARHEPHRRQPGREGRRGHGDLGRHRADARGVGQ